MTRQSAASQSKRRWRTSVEIRDRARELRRDMTPVEGRLWQHLRDKQLAGLRFRRQHPVDRFILDFYCPQHKLAVEVDGDIHASQVECDQVRTQWLEARGYRMVRFTNRQIEKELPEVLEEILRVVEREERPPPPAPICVNLALVKTIKL